jgi:triosephosphate isomerase
MKNLIIANWKMAPNSLKEAKKIFSAIKKAAGRAPKATTVVCQPFVYLPVFRSLPHVIKLGSQDIFWADKKTSFTGEISAPMLKGLGVKYVIVGHSERREHFGETNGIVNKKIKYALGAGLKVVFCVGEKGREGGYFNFIKQEMHQGLAGVRKKDLKNLIVAYEPIWAIGKSAKSADTPEDAQEMAIYIRRIFLAIAGSERARKLPVLYGGSVDPKNAGGFLAMPGISGLLVGHESRVPGDFAEILKIANEH